MDENYTEMLWEKTNQTSRLNAKIEREARQIAEHQISKNGLPLNIPLFSLFASNKAKKRCVSSLYQKQFGFLEDHVRPSEMYRTCREIELLEDKLTTDSEFRKQFFGNYLKSTGKKNKNVVRRLRNHDIRFVIDMITKRTPCIAKLTDMTMNNFNDDYKHRIIGDRTIKYSAKKRIMKLFPYPVTYQDLKNWNIDPPEVFFNLPVQFYNQFHFSSWVTGTYSNNKPIANFFFFNKENTGENNLEKMIEELETSVEWKGKSYYKYLRENDVRSFRKRKSDRESEKIDIALFFTQTLNIVIAALASAEEEYRMSKEKASRLSSEELSERSRRQKLYANIYKNTSRFSSASFYDNNYSRILRSNRKTYVNWAKTYDIPFEFIDHWKADQDSKEDKRRETEADKGGTMINTAGDLEFTLLPNSGAYNLLFTLEDQLNKQLVEIDEIFRQKTGYSHPMAYLTMINNKNEPTEANFKPVVQKVIEKRNHVAAQLGLVQDKIAEIDGVYKIGSLANKSVSGNTFVKEALTLFLPHAFAKLSTFYEDDNLMNKTETNVKKSKKNLQKARKLLNHVENCLIGYVSTFHNPDFDEIAARKRDDDPKAATDGTGADLPPAVPAVPAVPADPPTDDTEDTESEFTSILQTVLPVAAHYIERVAVEGGSPERFDEYTEALNKITSLSERVAQNKPFIQNILPTIIKQYVDGRRTDHKQNIGASLAKNRLEKGSMRILDTYLWSPHGYDEKHETSKNLRDYMNSLKSCSSSKIESNMHLPVMLSKEETVSESISMIDLFESQITKAARSIQDNMTKESSLPDVGLLEQELEKERSRLIEMREKRIAEEKIMTEKFRLSEVARIEQERDSQKKLEKINMERIAAEEERMKVQEQSEERLRISAEKESAARFEIEQQKVAFQKERIELQNKNEELSDSISELSELDITDHVGWNVSEDVSESNNLEEEAEQETLVEQVALSKQSSVNNDADSLQSDSSDFSDFSLDFSED